MTFTGKRRLSPNNQLVDSLSFFRNSYSLLCNFDFLSLSFIFEKDFVFFELTLWYFNFCFRIDSFESLIVSPFFGVCFAIVTAFLLYPQILHC